MRVPLIRIGNSRGIRIPKPLIEQAGLGDQVELAVEDGRIVISRVAPRREGWEAAAAQAARRDEDRLLDPPPPTEFDREEWEW